MINKKISILLITLALLNNCSFDSKTGIWGDAVKEKKKITELEKKQKELIKVEKIYSSDVTFSKEVILNKSIVLSKPQNNLSWIMSSSNYQNFLGNLYLSGIDKSSRNPSSSSLASLKANLRASSIEMFSALDFL